MGDAQGTLEFTPDISEQSPSRPLGSGCHDPELILVVLYMSTVWNWEQVRASYHQHIRMTANNQSSA